MTLQPKPKIKSFTTGFAVVYEHPVSLTVNPFHGSTDSMQHPSMVQRSTSAMTSQNLLWRHVKEQLGDEVVDAACPVSHLHCLFSSCKTVNAGVVEAAAAATFTSEPGQPLHKCTTLSEAWTN